MSTPFRRIAIGIALVAMVCLILTVAYGSDRGWPSTVHSQANDVATPFVVTATPSPANVFEAATRSAEQTVQAETTGTVTPVPMNWVLATNTPTPWLVTATPTAENQATAAVMIAEETAVAVTTGTPDPSQIVVTSTPRATPNTVRSTSSSSSGRTQRAPTPIGILVADITPTPVTVQIPFPQELVGKILFLSDVYSNNPKRPNAFAINPDGTGLTLLTSTEFHTRAQERDGYSSGRHYHALALREQGGSRNTQIFYKDANFGTKKQLTYFGAGVAWDPTWSPTDDVVAFVSSESGNDEIWINRIENWPAQQLTKNTWEWDKSPSFSPDGEDIVFMSNRDTGRQQLWLMNKNGGNIRRIGGINFEAWDPVWVKTTDQ